jgi:hypothetical protein
MIVLERGFSWDRTTQSASLANAQDGTAKKSIKSTNSYIYRVHGIVNSGFLTAEQGEPLIDATKIALNTDTTRIL